MVPYSNVRAINYTDINRFSGYAQWNRRSKWGEHEIFTNIGVRGHQWQVSGDGINGKSQMTISPRAQFAIKPSWKSEMFYSEFREGCTINHPFIENYVMQTEWCRPNVKAQSSVHFVIGSDYSFKMWRKTVSNWFRKLYYKSDDRCEFIYFR